MAVTWDLSAARAIELLAQGNPVYNFSYVDQIYDGLLQNGVRPFVEISFMPNQHGNTLAAYEKMGKPTYPTRAQIEQLNRASEVVPQKTSLKNGKLEVELSPNALVVLEIER